MNTTVDDVSNNNSDGTEASVLGHSLDGRLSRPTSAWKSQRRRPKFTSLDGDDLALDLEVLDLDDGDSSDDNADLLDLRDVLGTSRSTGNGTPLLMMTRKETKLATPLDWVSKSSVRTPRAWQEGNDLAENQTRGSIRGPLARRGSGEASPSECDSNSSTDTLSSSGKVRHSSCETAEFNELQNELASSGQFCVGGRVIPRYRAACEGGREGDFQSRGGGDALIPVGGQTHDIRYPTRPLIPRETNQLAYSHLRQKLRPIEKRIVVPVEAEDGDRKDVKSKRKTRLRPLMTKRARALIFGLRQTDGKSEIHGFSRVTQRVTAVERVSGESRRVTRGVVGASEPEKAVDMDARKLGKLGSVVVKEKLILEDEVLTCPATAVEVRAANEDLQPTPRMRDALFHQSHEKMGSHEMGRSTKTENVSALDALERTTGSPTTSEDTIKPHTANNPVNTEAVRRNSVERATAGSEVTLSRDSVGIRPKFVGPECFESSTALAQSWKSSDVASMYPIGPSKTSSSPGHLFYATNYTQFLPNDLNLEEFSLFDGDFTKSYRPSSPEPSDDVQRRPEPTITAAPTEPERDRGSAQTLTMPTMRVSTASTETPMEETDYLAASPSPSIALSLSLSTSMIADDDELATARIGAPSSRVNTDRRPLVLADEPPPPYSSEVLKQVVAPVEAPRISREGPIISRSLVRSVSFADEPIVVPHKQFKELSVTEQSDLSPHSARFLAHAPSEPTPSDACAPPLQPSPPQMAPSRLAGVTHSRLVAMASPRPVAVASPRQAALSSPKLVALASPGPVTMASTKPVAVASQKPVTMASPRQVTMASPRQVTMASQRPVTMASPKPAAVASPQAATLTLTRQSSRMPSEASSKVPSVFNFPPSETQPPAPSKVPLTTHFTPSESLFLSPPPKAPIKTQLVPSEMSSLASRPSSFPPPYESPKSDGLPFNSSTMYSPWGQQSLADMWSEAQKGLNQTNNKTSFL